MSTVGSVPAEDGRRLAASRRRVVWPYDVGLATDDVHRVRDALDRSWDVLGQQVLRTLLVDLDVVAEIATDAVEQGIDHAAVRRAVHQQLREVTALQQTVRERMLELAFRMHERIDDALGRLGGLPSSAAAIDAAPRELCRACGFDRALVSGVSGASWTPRALHVARDAEHPRNVRMAAITSGTTLSLATSEVEATVVRRRVPALVSGVPGAPGAPARARSCGYVVAPIVCSTGVVGLLHADAGSTSRTLGEAERDDVQTFAAGLALVLERMINDEHLSVHRSEMRHALASALDRVGTLADPVTGLHRSPARGAGEGSAAKIGRLTPRQREVLALLAAGATNAVIAERLVIAECTVKSHVGQITRKLGVTNRTAAVAQYLRLARREHA